MSQPEDIKIPMPQSGGMPAPTHDIGSENTEGRETNDHTERGKNDDENRDENSDKTEGVNTRRSTRPRPGPATRLIEECNEASDVAKAREAYNRHRAKRLADSPYDVVFAAEEA